MPPPWNLVSPHGVLHHVRDDAALLALARSTPGLYHEQKRNNLLRELVDPGNKKGSDTEQNNSPREKPPAHVSQGIPHSSALICARRKLMLFHF